MRLLIVILLSWLRLNVSLTAEKRCGNVDIRNTPNGLFHNKTESTFREYLACTVIEGDLTIAMVGNAEPNPDVNFPVFSHLREITGSVLLYEVKWLTSLGHVLPALRVIGGHSLIMNYALVVYRNEALRNLGLSHLTTIRNGGVRIMENPKLCYVKNINWDSILVGKIRDVIIEEGGAHQLGLCKDVCNVNNKGACQKHPSESIACWNATTCQLKCDHSKNLNNTIGPGCDLFGKRCHEQCVGGCEVANDPRSCYACLHVNYNGTCMSECPAGVFEYHDRRCVTEQECRKFPVITVQDKKVYFKPFQGKCHYDCPQGYQEGADPEKRECVKCIGHCPKKCQGGTVESIGDALRYSKCNIIENELEVNIRVGAATTSPEKFTEAFGEIEEIMDYLSIKFSSSIQSLYMFKNLRKIHGNKVAFDRYALQITENESLRKLFNVDKQTIDILNGSVSINSNRMLCYNEITNFLNHTGLTDDALKDFDVSQVSNGDRAVCNVVPLKIENTTSTDSSFLVHFAPFNTTDMDYRKFTGYEIYYKKVDHIDHNMTIHDNRSVCMDSWSMNIIAVENQGADVGKLEADSLYAFYVQTRLISHPGARTAVSNITYVRTLFGVPDPPIIKQVQAGPNEIAVEFYAPLKPQGRIAHYTIEWLALDDFNDVEIEDPCIEAASKLFHSDTVAVEEDEGTCPADKGCCKCSDESEEDDADLYMAIRQEHTKNAEEKANFENSVQNSVFKQRCSVNNNQQHCGDFVEYYDDAEEEALAAAIRTKRHINNNRTPPHRRRTKDYFVPAELANPQPLTKRQQRSLKSNIEQDKALEDESVAKVPVPRKNKFLADNNPFRNAAHLSSNVSENGTYNVTLTKVVISNLSHYTTYDIAISACQDRNANPHYCSNPVHKSIVTEPILEKDFVNASSVKVEKLFDKKGLNKENERRIIWDIPTNTNGAVLGFRIKVYKDGNHTPIAQCIKQKEFIEKKGVLFSGLSNGVYSAEIRTVSLYGVSDALVLNELFEIYVPGWFTWYRILGIVLGVILFIAICAFIIWRYFQRHYGKKMEEYLQVICVNPEYVLPYKIDEWELKREDIILHEEIGRGTFGKVLRGTGNNVKSNCGIVFGNCAVKTVPECASNSERLHFLIEASVMKQFNTAYIVKLYGVVSEGLPVLVVMEMMDQGNLRDYLRARRPNTNDNPDDNPLPDMKSYFNWASQIADGMAYLESLKFCHRDLAARNCMVSADHVVKIGDFGMARDIYYHEYYKPAGKRLMPVRWMAPESLKDGMFTIKSDVWSYGIVLYEMVTLGQQPYAGLGNDQVFHYIGVKRNILVRPVNCLDFWYDLMRVCWKYDPRDRPSFYQICMYLYEKLDSIFHDTVVFDTSFVISQRQDREDDVKYNFDYNEDEEEAKKHNILRELANINQKDEEQYEYYKLGFGAAANPNSEVKPNDDLGRDDEGAKFTLQALDDLQPVEKSPPPPLTKKQIKTRDKEREKFHARQREIEREREAKGKNEKIPEEIELKTTDSETISSRADSEKHSGSRRIPQEPHK